MRHCACGCGVELPPVAEHRSKYASPACRSRASREARGAHWVSGSAPAHRTPAKSRKRAPRPGVTVYIADPAVAERAAWVLDESAEQFVDEYETAALDAAASIRKALARKKEKPDA